MACLVRRRGALSATAPLPWAALLVCAPLPAVAPAQQMGTAPTAAIVGRLVDRDSRAALRGARVSILGAHHDFAADSDGRFADRGLSPGTYVVQARAVGYATTSWVVYLEDGQTVTQEFELALLPYTLDPVVVQRPPGFAEEWRREFEGRRASGRGYFITEEQIDAARPHALVDLLRNVPGVRLLCAGASHCTVRMARAARQCRVDYVVDGFPATNSTSPDMAMVGVIAVEVYRTLSETPIQFLKADNVCGTIVIWTRSGPRAPSDR